MVVEMNQIPEWVFELKKMLKVESGNSNESYRQSK